MADTPKRVVLLAGRLAPDDARPLARLVERLRGMDISAEVVCGSGPTPSFHECKGLTSRWGRALAVRRLAAGEGPGRPDLLHVLKAEMDAAGLDLAERWGVPYVQTVDDYLLPGSRLRLSRRWCRALVATSDGLAEDLIAGAGVPRTWVSVIPPGIDVPDLALPPDDPTRVPVIGAAGRLEAGSGLATFLDAARRVVESGVDAEFVVVGEGPGEADLRRLADRLGITGRLTFAGTPPEGQSIWSVLDVFCQTARRPSAGRALAAALTHGVPGIASDVEGLRSWIDDGRTGLLVSPTDSEALARAILGFLADPESARSLGREARVRIARDFDPTRQAGALTELYERVIAAGSAPLKRFGITRLDPAPDTSATRFS